MTFKLAIAFISIAMDNSKIGWKVTKKIEKAEVLIKLIKALMMTKQLNDR